MILFRNCSKSIVCCQTKSRKSFLAALSSAVLKRDIALVNKSSISQAQSHREIGEFWDTHDLADYWEQTEPVEFEVDIKSEVRYYALESALAAMVAKVAWQRRCQ
jgi:hypothetical protein